MIPYMIFYDIMLLYYLIIEHDMIDIIDIRCGPIGSVAAMQQDEQRGLTCRMLEFIFSEATALAYIKVALNMFNRGLTLF